MNRRQWLTRCTGLLAFAGVTSVVAGEGHVDYTPDVYEQSLTSGEPFMLDFYASW